MASIVRPKRRRFTVYRLPLALLILVALTSQFAWGLQQPHFAAYNFFCYFTILANVFAVFVLLSAVVSVPSHELDVFRGAAVVSLTIVWIVFSFFLSNLDVPLLPWVNAVLHYAAPPLLLLDWLLDPPPGHLSVPDLLAWLLFPFAYLIFTLLRGSYINWYPYWFLNPKVVGYTGIITYAAGIFVVTILIAMVLYLIAAGMRSAFRVKTAKSTSARSSLR
jgi:hypothetical protein